MNRPEEHAARHRAVGHRADRMADLLRHAADGEAEAGAATADPTAAAAQPRQPPAGSPAPPPQPAPGRRPATAPPPGAGHDPRGRARAVAARARSRRRASPARSRSRAAASTTSRYAIPRDGRPEVAAGRAARARRAPASVLCRVRLGPRRRHHREAARRRDVWKQQGPARSRRPSGDARLRQRRRARVPPHHLGRRQVPVHASATRS